MNETASSSSEHRTRLECSQRKWDFWSSRERIWDFYEQDTLEYRKEAVSQLGLQQGDAVLDVGCGPGANFDLLRDAIGPEGHVLGIDYSPGMIERASERIDANGWTNVETVRADATRPSLDGERFDGALATTAVSATPDVRATVENVYDALRPGARFAVYEIRAVPSGPGRVLNPLIRRFYRAFGNWNSEEDVLEQLGNAFEDVTVVETFALRTNYIAVASKSSGNQQSRE